MVKKPNIRGIIQSIMRLVDCCLGSAVGIDVIFCRRNIEAPTRMGSMGVGSGRARSSEKKMLFSGTTPWTQGSQGYRCLESPTRLSGVEGRVWRRAWYSPIQIGNWMNIGPRQPSGLTPCSR